mmetsp:Transcript_24228/g.50770  ORF Transcript_24228/g.50770 Transcript_24228/m.50770 type:complete len:82 (+) Transcript_24228:111-356(+)
MLFVQLDCLNQQQHPYPAKPCNGGQLEKVKCPMKAPIPNQVNSCQSIRKDYAADNCKENTCPDRDTPSMMRKPIPAYKNNK